MEYSENKHPEVLIVGAGPTGLTMACELARHGVQSRIIDKASAPSDKSKAFGIHARTLELFENIGIIDSVLELGNKCYAVSFYQEGEPLASLNVKKIESKYPFFYILAQSDTEKLLIDHLDSYGIQVERETELLSFEQNDEQVVAAIKRKDGTQEETAYTYLVGCDGAHSSTRKLLGLDFKGAPYPNYWLLADCNPEWEYPKDELAVFIHPTGATAYFPLYGDRGRLMYELPKSPIDEEMSEPTIEDVQRLASERDIKYTSITEPTWLAYFKLHHRMVNKYSEGRVFIGGDAAHIHSPVGGQGMNTGIQDAYNLAWKMALVLKGKSPASLLDSYNIERHRIGADVVHLTDRATKAVGLRNPVLQAIRNKMISIVTKIDAVQEKMLRRLSQIEVHYKGSPIVDEKWTHSKDVKDFQAVSDDLKAGERVDDFSLLSPDRKTTTQLYDLFQGSEHELLLFTGRYPEQEEITELKKIYNDVSEKYGNLIEIHLIKGEQDLSPDFPSIPSTHIDENFKMHEGFGSGRASLYLVRPDGYVAFRNQPAGVADLMEYLSGIFLA